MLHATAMATKDRSYQSSLEKILKSGKSSQSWFESRPTTVGAAVHGHTDKSLDSINIYMV